MLVAWRHLADNRRCVSNVRTVPFKPSSLWLTHSKELLRGIGNRHLQIHKRTISSQVGVKDPVRRGEVGVLLHGIALAADGCPREAKVVADESRADDLCRNGAAYEQIDPIVAVSD